MDKQPTNYTTVMLISGGFRRSFEFDQPNVSQPEAHAAETVAQPSGARHKRGRTDTSAWTSPTCCYANHQAAGN